MTRLSQRARRSQSGGASRFVLGSWVDARSTGRIDVEFWNDCSMHGIMDHGFQGRPKGPGSISTGRPARCPRQSGFRWRLCAEVHCRGGGGQVSDRDGVTRWRAAGREPRYSLAHAPGRKPIEADDRVRPDAPGSLERRIQGSNASLLGQKERCTHCRSHQKPRSSSYPSATWHADWWCTRRGLWWSLTSPYRNLPATTPFTLTSYMWHRAEASESNSSAGATLSARTSTGTWSNWDAERHPSFCRTVARCARHICPLRRRGLRRGGVGESLPALAGRILARLGQGPLELLHVELAHQRGERQDPALQIGEHFREHLLDLLGKSSSTSDADPLSCREPDSFGD